MTNQWNWDNLAGNWDEFRIDSKREDHTESDGTPWYDVRVHLRRGQTEYMIRAREPADAVQNKLNNSFRLLTSYLANSELDTVEMHRVVGTTPRPDGEGNLMLDAPKARVTIIDHSK